MPLLEQNNDSYKHIKIVFQQLKAKLLLSFAISFTSTQIQRRVWLHYTQLEKFCLTFLLSALCQSEFVKVRRACGVCTSSQLQKVCSTTLYCCIIVAVLKWTKSSSLIIPYIRVISISGNNTGKIEKNLQK